MPRPLVAQLAKDATVEVARTGLLPEGFLAELWRLFDADAGAGVATFRTDKATNPTGVPRIRDVAIETVGTPSPPPGMLEKAAEVSGDFPGITQLSTRHVTRLSDHVELPAYWDTPVYEVMNGWYNGRYPIAAQLHETDGRTQFLAIHRQDRDFSDDEVQALATLQRPLAAAYAYRHELDVCIRRLGDADRAASTPSDVPYRPTKREAEVLALLQAGWTNHQIGRRLGITERTVRKHLGNVYDKAGIPGRAAAALWWRDRM